MIKNIYIGGDESYDNSIDKNFSLAFCVFEDVEILQNTLSSIDNFLQNNNLGELKYDKSDISIKEKVFKLFNKHQPEILFYKNSLKNKNLQEVMELGLKTLAREVREKYGNSNYYIKIDEIFDKKWQHKIKKGILGILKTQTNDFKNKVEFVFVDSKKNIIVQIADFYAGLSRRRELGKDKELWKYLNKK